MSNWSEQQVLKKEVKEKDKTRKENLAKYFLDLSKLTFMALVLGSITQFYIQDNAMPIYSACMFLIGGILTSIILAMVGNFILK